MNRYLRTDKRAVCYLQPGETETSFVTTVVKATLRCIGADGVSSDDMEELVGAGGVGLARGLRSYDPTLGAALRTWLSNSISSSVLDEARRLNRWRGQSRGMKARGERVEVLGLPEEMDGYAHLSAPSEAVALTLWSEVESIARRCCSGRDWALLQGWARGEMGRAAAAEGLSQARATQLVQSAIKRIQYATGARRGSKYAA